MLADPTLHPAAKTLPRAHGADAATAHASVEHVELTMSHLGLGNLNEYALMVLFGNAHSHRLVAGTAVKPDGFMDARGNALYPAYFMTTLKVPTCNLLRSFKLWEQVDVGVEVRRFGDTLLESRYALGRERQLGDEADAWDAARWPTMSGNNLIVIDTVEGGGTTHRQVSAPAADRIAALPKQRTVPSGVASARKARAEGLSLVAAPRVALQSRRPIEYVVRPGIDAAPGHAMIFAKFSEVMDHAEHQFLGTELQPGLPLEALANLQVVERETYYFGNCFGGEALSIGLAGGISLLDGNAFDEASNSILAAELNLCFEVSRVADRSLVSIARVKKLMAIPVKDQDLVRDVMRIVSRL